MEKRSGEWLTTYAGYKFYPLDPRVEEIHLKDIAHALSQVCRFAGQSKYFYSVAQHCLNVAADLKERGYGAEIQLIGLLHDASEAYICDIPSPFKRVLKDYKEIEIKIEETVYQAFHLEKPTEEVHKIVKEADVAVLFNEATVLMPNIDGWITNQENRKISIDIRIRPMIEVEQEYLDVASKLLQKVDQQSLQQARKK